MKLVKTAMLASAFAFASTLAFAQVSVGGSTGVNAGTTSQGGSANVNSGVNGNVKAGGVNAHATTGAGVSTKKRHNRINGSTSDTGKVQLDTK